MKNVIGKKGGVGWMITVIVVVAIIAATYIYLQQSAGPEFGIVLRGVR